MMDKEGMNKGCIVKVDWDYEDEEDNKIRWREKIMGYCERQEEINN